MGNRLHAKALLFSAVISIFFSVNLGVGVKWAFLTSFTAEDSNVNEVDPDYLAQSFVRHYYSTFDTNRAGLAYLYKESSMLTFEGEKIQGAKNIVAKLASLPFEKSQHSVRSIDSQASGPGGGVLVYVGGYLQISGQQHALLFSQVFHLVPTPQGGGYYVLNEIFRLING